MVRERRLLREREREDHLYADKEKFVTAAYRAKLEADAKWIREDAARDAAEAADDVAKKSDLSGFYGGFARAHLERRGEHPTTTTTPEATKKKTDEVGGGAGSAEGAARDPTRGASAAAKAKAAAEEEGRARRAAAEALRAKTPSEETRKGSETAPTPKADAAPGAPDAKALAAEKAAAARERYLARKRKQGHDGS
jgi:coiled-coil domain-containing protein 55